MDQESDKLDAALRNIGMFGNLDGVVAGRNQRIVLIRIAQNRGLVVWNRSRGCYQLTPAGYSRAAAGRRQCRMSFRKRVSPRRNIVAAGLAVVVAGCIVVGAARVTSNDDVRKPELIGVHDVASVGPVAARVQSEPGALTMQREPDLISQQTSTLAPNNGEPSAGESRAADSLAPPTQHQARKVARTHRQQRHADPREPRPDMGPALGFAQDERFASRGHPMYSQTPWPRGAFGRPNGWGW